MLSPLIVVGASLLTWCLLYRSLVRHPLDPVALTMYYLGLQLVWRPLVLAIRIDTPFPTEIFADRDTGGLIIRTQLMVILWLLALWAGARLLVPFATPFTWLFPRTRTALDGRRLLLISAALSGVALVATAALWARYGGPTGLILASKVGREVVESRALRSVPLLGALFGIAAFLSVRSGPSRSHRLTALTLVALNGYLNFTWGARDVPILSVVALVGGSLLFARRASGGAGDAVSGAIDGARWRRRFALVAVLALTAAFSLRAARDTLLWQDLAPTIEGEGAVRQLAVATNNTFYDTLLLIADDWPDRYDLHGGDDFVRAAVAAAPTVIAGPQEPFASPAVRVAQTYLDRNNGFPATAVGDWYLNLGVPGVAIGGLLSGLVVLAAQRALHRFADDPLVWAVSLVFMVRIFPGGVWATSIPKWVVIGVPIIVVVIALDRLIGRTVVPAAPCQGDRRVARGELLPAPPSVASPT